MCGAFVPVRRRPGLARSGGDLRAAVQLAWCANPPAMLVYCVLLALTGAGPVAAAILIRRLVDGLVAGSPVLTAAAALAAVGLVLSLIAPVRGYVRDQVLRSAAARSLDRLYAHSARLAGLARLEDPRFQQDLRLIRESAAAGAGRVADDVLSAGAAAVSVAGLFGVLCGVHRGWGVLVVLAGFAAAAARHRFAPDPSGGASASAERQAYFGSLLTSAAAAKEVRLLRLGDFFRSRMRSETAYAGDGSRRARRQLSAHVIGAGLAAIIGGAALVWAAVRVNVGGLGVGDFAVVAIAVAVIPRSAQATVRRIVSARHALAAFGRQRALEAAEPDLPEPSAPIAVPALTVGIELTDVWFRYAPDRPWVLRGVTFTIPYGQTVALVGLNGAGKSTLIKLLCRFYDPTLGTIRWDGHDLRRLRVDELRTRIGAVFQDFMRYDLSAAENIGLGDVGTLTGAGEPEKVRWAARLAGVHETVQALPLGYDTPLTPTALSGGQWQRIATARAFLRGEPDLMILDEPASGLDAYAESELHQRFRDWRAGRTGVLVSHRLAAVRDADLIIVLADGKVAESGRHADLLAKDGRYAHLFRLQAAGYTPA